MYETRLNPGQCYLVYFSTKFCFEGIYDGKSNRKTIHFAHEISDILAVQRKQMWPRYEAKSVNAMHSETGVKAHKLL